jgi:release factor glutamine methyltransferase
VWATEVSPAAAAWARANVSRFRLGARVTVREGDLFAPVAELAGRCDLVVANPPYLARPVLATLPDEVRRWEPALALDGGPDGLAVIGRLLAEAPVFLRPGGTLLIEIGEDQAEAVRRRLATDRRYGVPSVLRDFRGRDRVVAVRRA